MRIGRSLPLRAHLSKLPLASAAPTVRVGQVMWAEFSAPEGTASVSPVDPLVFGAALQLYILLGSPSILEALNGYLRS